MMAPSELDQLEAELRGKLRHCSEEDEKAVKEALRTNGAITRIRVIWRGICEFAGVVVVDSVEYWFSGVTISGKFELFPNFREFWNYLEPWKQTTLSRLGETLILGKGDEIVERYGYGDTRHTWKEWPQSSSFGPQNIVSVLLDKILALEEKVEKMYNAPGMPGCVEAEASFYSKAEEAERQVLQNQVPL